MHNDLKWDKILIEDRRRSTGDPGRLGACRSGEPEWDVGSVIAAYVSFWLYSIDVIPDLSRATFGPGPLSTGGVDARDQRPLERRNCGVAISRMRAGGWPTRRFGWLERACSLRRRGDPGGSDLDPHVVLHVQLAANLLSRPHDQARRLGLVTQPTRAVSRFHNQIAAALDVVAIARPWGFSWAGPGVRARSTPGSARDRGTSWLNRHLHTRLYADFYISGGAASSVRSARLAARRRRSGPRRDAVGGQLRAWRP